MKPKHQRLIFVAVSLVFLCISALLTLQAFRENLIFFYTPSELFSQEIAPSRLIRIGGLVEAGSVIRTQGGLRFKVTDGAKTLAVSYEGLPPALFREGQGVVAEGHLEKSGQFAATRVLAKHDERYMPREVVDALKKSGRWKEREGLGVRP